MIPVILVLFAVTNLFLIYSDKSKIEKAQKVSDYERLVAKDFTEKMLKEAFIAPEELHTIYVHNDDAVNAWLVNEGDDVMVGQELATLDTNLADGQRAVWEAEKTSLSAQESELESLKRELESMRSNMNSSAESKYGDSNRVTELKEKTMIELDVNIGFKVDVSQEGSFAQAISAIDQQLSDIQRQLVVLDAQLLQDTTKPALISPVSGTVSKIIRHGATLAIDIYSEQQLVVTYAKEDEWQKFESGQQVVLQSKLFEEVVEGTVSSVASVPASADERLAAYQELDQVQVNNPLAYYEMRISLDGEVTDVPFATNVKADITVNEAFDAVAVPKNWAKLKEDHIVETFMLAEDGRPTRVESNTPFETKTRYVLTDGLVGKNVVIYEPELEDYTYAPRLFMNFPSDSATKKDLKKFGRRQLVKSIIGRK